MTTDLTAAVEAAARAHATDMGLDLDDLAAHADPGDTEEDLIAWRRNLVDSARVCVEAAAPLIVADVRAQLLGGKTDAMREAAALAIAARWSPSKHGQMCPVWAKQKPVEACECWIMRNARGDADAALMAALSVIA